MARVTVEGCLEQIPNRFDMTLLASKRARKLAMSGIKPMVKWENDKPTVVALREIEAGLVLTESDLNKERATEKPTTQAAENPSSTTD